MDWKEAIRRWRALPPEERLRREWESIPENVAEIMAFAGEPVDLELLREQHSKRPRPAVLKNVKRARV